MAEKPVYVMPENVSRTLGREAQRNNILAAKIIADIIKTTLGPKGMDKMLVDSFGNVIVTNDGVTILEEMEIDHPVAKMIVEIAKTQETEVGDGTTTAALLAGKLLENAEKLLDKKIHPTIIVKGYRLAAEKAADILNNLAKPVEDKNVLKQIAMTAMTGKGAEGNKERLAELIVNAIEQIAETNEADTENIKIEKVRGDSVKNSEFIKGFVFEKERANIDMPKKVENGKILLVDFSLELRNPETEAKISVSSPEQLDNFIKSEEKYLKDMTQKIISSGANVVFCQKGVDDVAQYYLAQAGIFVCRRVSKSDIEKISRATSAKILSNLNDISAEYIGEAGIVEEIKHGEQSFVCIKECKNPKVVTIIVRGGTVHIVDEIERAIKDAIGDIASVIKSGKIVAGGGAVEIEVSKRLKAYSRTFSGREQLAVEEFANSLESVPEALAENAGLDTIEILTELKKRHEAGMIFDGLNLFKNNIENCFEAGIIEPLKVKTQAISSASEVATMILRIDDVLVSGKARQKNQNSYEEMD